MGMTLARLLIFVGLALFLAGAAWTVFTAPAALCAAGGVLIGAGAFGVDVDA